MGKRNHECLKERNRRVIERVNYWSEVKRIRFDDVLQMVGDEFFIRPRTVMWIFTRNKQSENSRDDLKPPPRESGKSNQLKLEM